MARSTDNPSSRPAQAKPYDRPPQAAYQLKYRGSKGKPSEQVERESSKRKQGKGKGKSVDVNDDLPASLQSEGMSTSVQAGSASGINIGAPSQAGQSSRKGKKSWRKNVDIAEIERGMEDAREEERVTGGKLVDRRSEALFTVDVTGDEKMAANLARNRPKKPLRSLAVLSERSAVPSLTSRTVAPSTNRKPGLSPQEKARLRRLAMREHRPDGASGPQLGVAPATLSSDAWEAAPPPPTVPGGFGLEAIAIKAPKTPVTLARQRELRAGDLKAGRHTKSDLPSGGTSYNPTQESHSALIDSAVQEELAKLAREAKDEEEIAALGQVVINRKIALADNTNNPAYPYAEGMAVGPGDLEDDDSINEVDESLVPSSNGQPRRKTTAERNKALRRKIAEQERKAAVAQDKLNRSVGTLGSFKRAEEARLLAHAEAVKARKEQRREKELLGVHAGVKVGKYRVPKGDVVVQLGEDLAETLRQIKPEGNAFKDRFLSLQKKGLIEPRLPTSKRNKIGKKKEFEKHAYKRFE